VNFAQTMKELKKLGTSQSVKVYKRHGAGGDLFGVSFANLGKLKKKINIDHELAVELWESGNVDAQTLATMVADPALLTPAVADNWVKEIGYYLIADCFSGLVARTSFAAAQMAKWMKSKHEYVRQCGYSVLASALKNDAAVSDAACRQILNNIERQIHDSPNRAKHAMNMAICAIGIFRPILAEVAIETARRVGKVKVDHGQTSCQTPDAASYIEKAMKRAGAKKTVAKKRKK